MPFTGTFTKTDTSATAYNSFELEDTSSFVDEPKSTFSDRKVYLVKVDGTYVTAGSQTIAIIGVAPTATITIDSVPADGYNITITLPVSMGGAVLGSYTKQSSDTTTTILAASIAAAIAPSGLTISTDLNVISIQFSVETSDYNGDSLVITYEQGDNATSNLPLGGISPSTSPGDVITTQVQLPDYTFVTIGTYTKQVSDSNAIILADSVYADILVENPTSYVVTHIVGASTYIYIEAPSGLGTTQNTRIFWFLVNDVFNGESNTFTGGTDGGVIPNTITPFTGGVTEGTETVTGLDYFDWPFDSGDTIAINALTEDISLSIMVVWVSLNQQSGSTYSAVIVDDFVDYAEQFMFNKCLQLAGNRWLISNNNFKSTFDITRTLIDSSATCIVFQDQYSSQRCIEDVSVIENNLNMFY